jgi:hypothetical protein
MSTPSKVPKEQVALGLSKLTVSQLITDTKLWTTSITGNTYFPNPSPSIATVNTQLSKLEAAYTVSQTRVKGSGVAMHSERKALELLLKSLGSYVEGVGNATPDQAAVIIDTTHMPRKKRSPHKSKVFTVETTRVPGEVMVNNKAVRNASYVYAMTTDPNTPSTWIDIISSRQVKNVHGGLISGTRYYFRTAVSIKGVLGAWSPVVNLVMP